MNDTTPQSALREWRAHMVNPARAASLLGAAVVLTIMGPFNTGEVLRALPAFAYWATIVVTCYSIGFLAHEWARKWAQTLPMRIAIAAPLTSFWVLMVIYLLNGFGIGYWATGHDLVLVAANVIVIACVITIVFHIVEHSSDAPKQAVVPPTLLDRLPFDKRAPLVSISVEDHYVRIRTIKGEEMILLRLADAIREVGETAGLQVHRSHWIATAQVSSAARKGDGAVLTMSNGDDIPVSRANVAAIKEAGLLPRS